MNAKQLERIANARDPRIRRIASKMGYQTRAMSADEPVEIKATIDDDLTSVRAEYEAKMGKKPYHGWDVETLRAKMAETEK